MAIHIDSRLGRFIGALGFRPVPPGLPAGTRGIQLNSALGRYLGALASEPGSGWAGGIANIMPPLAPTAPQPPPGLQREPEPPDVTAAIAAADPAVRISLRRDPVILAVVLSDLLVRALVIADRAALARARVRDVAHDLAIDVARAIRLAIPSNRGLLLTSTRELDLAIDVDLARLLALDLARRQDVARAVALALHLARDLDITLDADWILFPAAECRSA
jgi:hypothetical protein